MARFQIHAVVLAVFAVFVACTGASLASSTNATGKFIIVICREALVDPDVIGVV